MADGNKIDNQDFIEGTDEFAEILDDNFDAVYNVEDADFSDDMDVYAADEWAEDLEDITLDDDDQGHGYEMQNSTSNAEKNWFNIGVFGAVGLAACFLMYSYLPGILGVGTGSSVNTTPTNTPAMAQVEIPSENMALLDQALTIPSATDSQGQMTSSLLDNPEFLGDAAASPERPDPEASDNKIFEALGNVPAISDNEVDDIFAALNDLQKEQPATVITEQPQTLPVPADSEAVDEEGDVLDFIADTTTPRAPTSDTGVASVGVQAVVEESLPPVAVAATNDNSATASESGNADDMRVLNARIDMIMQRLETLATRVETLAEAEPVMAPAAASGNDNKVQSLEQTIRSLEKRIETLASEKAKVASAPARSTTTQPKKTTSKAKAASVKAAPQWELRGAAQGQAYIAEKGTQNLRTVAVGDTLNGLGRITSIAVEGGRWVVRGTSGQVAQ